MRDTYNGWTNQETWLLAINCDESILNLEETWRDYLLDENSNALRNKWQLQTLANALTDYWEAFIEDSITDKYFPEILYDLIYNSLDKVNWDEIAKKKYLPDLEEYLKSDRWSEYDDYYIPECPGDTDDWLDDSEWVIRPSVFELKQALQSGGM